MKSYQEFCQCYDLEESAPDSRLQYEQYQQEYKTLKAVADGKDSEEGKDMTTLEADRINPFIDAVTTEDTIINVASGLAALQWLPPPDDCVPNEIVRPKENEQL